MLPHATITADEILAARSDQRILSDIFQRADPFLRRMASCHQPYYPSETTEDIHQEYRESFFRAVEKYDPARAVNGLGFISFLNWSLRTDCRSHYRRQQSVLSRMDWGVLQPELETSPDMDAILIRAVSRLNPKDQKKLTRYLDREQSVPDNQMVQIKEKLRAILLELLDE